MKKRLLAMLLAAALVCALLPATALAAGDFTIMDGVLTKYTGPGGDVVIPSTVVGIGKSAFEGCKSLTSVTIPGSVTSIGEEAFYGCSSLTSVTIPDSVTTIGYKAFKDCESLTSVTIPDSVTYIGYDAFQYSGLTSVTIPGSVKEITDGDSMSRGDYAGAGMFRNCIGLTSVTIENGVTYIGKDAFRGCSSLTSVTIPDSVTDIVKYAFYECSNLTSVNIPSSVTSIGERAFSGCDGLTSVTIPGSVTSIGEWAFSGCDGLTSVTIENGTPSIGRYAFYHCDGLTSVTIPASVSDIGVDVFRDCSNLTALCGAEGSYAQLWAIENGYDFRATLPPAATPGKTAYAATQKIWVDGTAVEFQAYARKDKNGNLTNYVKLRDVASVLNGTAAQFQVGWDGSKVTITTGTAYTPLGSEMTTPYSGDRTYSSAGRDTVRFNGSSRDMDSLVLKDTNGGGYTYYKLRDLGWLLNFNVSWSPQWGVYIETNKPYDSTT